MQKQQSQPTAYTLEACYGDDQFFFTFEVFPAEKAAHGAPDTPAELNILDAYLVVETSFEGSDYAPCPMTIQQQERFIWERQSEWVPEND